MTYSHVLGRSKECDIVSNATDKPIELWMHHYNARSLIINLKTGDVLTYLFSDSHQSNAQMNFDRDALTQIEHKLFLEQEGDKVLFIFNTNFKTPATKIYVESLQSKGVTFLEEITVDIENEFSEFNTYRYGEIPTGFFINLNKATILKTFFGTEKGKDIDLPLISVGKDDSTLPNIKELRSTYNSLWNIARLISWADKRLPEELAKTDIDLSDLSNIDNSLSNIILSTIEEERAFSKERLYENNSDNDIFNTLEFIKNQGLNREIILELVEITVKQLTRRIVDLWKDEDEDDFLHLFGMAQKITVFATDFNVDCTNDVSFERMNKVSSKKIIELNINKNTIEMNTI
jgi:ferredoxin-fold anticodon binding domain-containing protein